jgi:hypothetical protein
MFWLCLGAFLVCGWVAAWITNKASLEILQEVNRGKFQKEHIEPLFWHIGNRSEVWNRHKAISPASPLRKKYLLGCLIGVAGFIIALFGFFIRSHK